MRMMSAAPIWLLIVGWFVLLSAVSFGARWWVRQRNDPDRQDELGDHANKFTGVVGATFAFLIGFAITISWSGVTAGQSVVEAEAAASQQLAWSAGNLKDQQAGQRISDALVKYLRVSASEDPAQLSMGDFGSLPSADALSDLQDTVHSVAYVGGSSVPEASGLVTAASAIAGEQAQLSAIASRALPSVVIVLLIASAVLLAIVIGMSTVTVHRPVLLVGWSLVAAIALSVVMTLDYPFSGDISVDLTPLSYAADRISS